MSNDGDRCADGSDYDKGRQASVSACETISRTAIEKLARLEVTGGFADPVECASSLELLREAFVSVGDEERVEKGRTSRLEGKIRVDNARSVLVSLLDPLRVSRAFASTDNVRDRPQSGHSGDHARHLERVESVESEDCDASTDSRETVVRGEEGERLRSIRLLPKVRLGRLGNFDVECLGDGDGKVMINFVPAQNVALLHSSVVATTKLELSGTDNVLVFDLGERVPEELGVRDVLVEALGTKATSDSLDVVRREGEAVGIDRRELFNRRRTEPVLSFAVRDRSVRGLETVRVIVRSGRNASLVLAVTDRRDEGANGSIDRERGEVHASEARDLSVVVYRTKRAISVSATVV